MLNLFYSYNTSVDDAYIITIKGNKYSEEYSKRCQQSCKAVGQSYKTWDAFDGTDKSKGIQIPDHSKDDALTQILKVTDHYLTRGEVACALSHISLWRHCAAIDKPIIVLEHDAIMVNKFEHHGSFNSIVYLGGTEWTVKKWPMLSIPPHASEGPNYHFICRAHAYSIDPTMAKNLLAYVIENGICRPLDIMMRVDKFHVTHQGLYAYDNNLDQTNDTSIKARALNGRTTERNDKLEW
jgi:GR25 family glycosyltransferase involved in LPS biosynthesis